MIDEVIKAIWFVLPAYVANMAPLACSHFKFLNYSLDGGKKFRNKPIFGSHKTLRGIVCAEVAGIIIAFIQFQLSPSFAILDYKNWLIIGVLMASGAMFGDLLESFFKRQLGKKAGSPFIPFDQVDFVVGALVFISVLYVPEVFTIVIILILTLFLHILTNLTAYIIKISEVKL